MKAQQCVLKAFKGVASDVSAFPSDIKKGKLAMPPTLRPRCSLVCNKPEYHMSGAIN